MLLHESPPSPFFILDNGLNPHIARMMAKLEYPIRSVQDEFDNPQGAIKDHDIINRIKNKYGYRGVWITKDISARRVQINLIKASRISVIWIRKQKLSTLQQHRIITYGFARVFQDLKECNHPIHYAVTFHGALNRERITFKTEWKP